VIKIEEKELIASYQNVLQLQIPVKEPGLMKLAKKNASRADGSSFKEKLFMRGVRTDLLKILNQIDGLWDFQRKKRGFVEREENESMDGPDRLYRWDSTGNNLLC
jgi:hypothetical protein